MPTGKALDAKKIALMAYVAATAALPGTGTSIAYLNGSGVTDVSDGAAWDGGIAPGSGAGSGTKHRTETKWQ